MIEAVAMRGGKAFEAYLRSILALIPIFLKANSAACRLPIVGSAQGAVLDRVLGPAESYEYVSTTSPAPPPSAY